jgi:hypothetical protein
MGLLEYPGLCGIGDFIPHIYYIDGEVPEWPKGTDCKSVGSAFGGSNPPLPIFLVVCVTENCAGIAQLARASAFQAEGRGFESRFPLHFFRRRAKLLVTGGNVFVLSSV